MASDCVQIGRMLAQSLQGAWRSRPPQWDLAPKHLEIIAPRLLDSGAAGLVCRRLDCESDTSQAVRALQRAKRVGESQALRHEMALREALSVLRGHGVEPILCKGWSIARRYAAFGSRPTGDIYLCVSPAEMPRAVASLTEWPRLDGWVDLHAGVPDLRDRSWSEVFGRSQLVALGDTEVRVLGAEDELRLLAIHFWRHLACRPVWLCDIAAAMEAISPEFDWPYFCAGQQRLTEIVLSVLALAQRLLLAEFGSRPPAGLARPVPAWLEQAALWGFGRGKDRSLTWKDLGRGQFPSAIIYAKFNPMRAVLRTPLGPQHAHITLQAASLLARPLQTAVRLGRAMGRIRRQRSTKFDLHRQRVY